MGLFNGASLERKVYLVEKDPVSPEDQEETSEDGRENMKAWFAENMRMIVSVVIVVVIAAGIYTYSKRAQAPNAPNKVASTEQNAEGKISVIGGDNESANTENTATDQTQVSEETQPQAQPAEKSPIAAPQTSQETENSFVETAAKGDGSTNLARRALANYLEKNADSSLSAEQKIYIEDFLRRQVKNGHLKVGDTREFSKDTIAKAIEKSKGLSEKQIQNLQQYAQRVPGLK